MNSEQLTLDLWKDDRRAVKCTVPPFVLPPVILEISFEDLLGRNCHAMPEATRRERWEAWKTLDADAASWWAASECAGCKHILGDWCDLVGLPASVSPVLSFRHGMVGMACMGMGRENPTEHGTPAGKAT